MASSCEFFSTEYSRNYKKQKLKPTEIIHQKDYFAERIEEGEIDPHTASIPTQLDESAEQLVYKHILDNLQSVYQVTYKHPREPRDKKEETETKEKDLQSELVAYIHELYFDPHNEKILAPPVTSKRILGYMRAKLLHGSLSIYQDTFGRTGATVIIQEHGKKNSTSKERTLEDNKAELNIRKDNICENLESQN